MAKTYGWLGLLSAVAIMAAAGCGASGGDNAATTGGSTTGGSTASKKAYKIVMIAKSSSNPVFLSAKTGAEAAAKELGQKNDVKIGIDWRTPPTEDGQVQAQKIAQAVSDGADAILISCSDAGKVTGAINSAVDKGVPVMTFDSDAPASKRFAFYGTDDTDCGTKVMDELAKQMGEKGNVAILAGNQNAPNLQKRDTAVREAAKKFAGIKIVGTYYHPETPEEAAAEVLKVMKSNPDIGGWAMVGGWPLFTQALLDLDPNKVKIVAVDALPPELAYVDKGIAPVLLAQPTYKWGYVSVEKIVDKIVLKKPVDTINKMELVRVSKENLGQWAKQLQDWGFTGIDPKYLNAAK